MHLVFNNFYDVHMLPWFIFFQTLSCISESVFSLQLELLAAGLVGWLLTKRKGGEWPFFLQQLSPRVLSRSLFPDSLLMVHTFAFRHCLPSPPKERARGADCHLVKNHRNRIYKLEFEQPLLGKIRVASVVVRMKMAPGALREWCYLL